MTSNLKSILQAFMQHIWNEGDFSLLDTYVSEQYTVRNDPGDAWNGQTLDRQTFQTRVMYSRNAFPNLKFDIQEMVAEDNRVVASWIMSGTHLGDLSNLPATGKSFAISGMTIYYFDGDQVCGHTQAYDRLGFIGQMGIGG